MKNWRKVVAGTCASLLMAAALCTAAQAADTPQQPTETIRVADSGIQPYADVIVTKYRMYEGKLQKRRWNGRSVLDHHWDYLLKRLLRIWKGGFAFGKPRAKPLFYKLTSENI